MSVSVPAPDLVTVPITYSSKPTMSDDNSISLVKVWAEPVSVLSVRFPLKPTAPVTTDPALKVMVVLPEAVIARPEAEFTTAVDSRLIAFEPEDEST